VSDDEAEIVTIALYIYEQNCWMLKQRYLGELQENFAFTNTVAGYANDEESASCEIFQTRR